MKQHQNIKITMLTCLVAGIAGVCPVLQAADKPESEAVTKLLADAKRQAFGISLDASTLDSYLRQPNLSWVSHAAEITRMKNDINEEAKTVQSLNSMRLQAAPWQTTAIDRIIPLMKEIADDTTSAIEFLNKNQTRLTNPDYKDLIEANSDTCNELATLISRFVDYGSHKKRYEDLREKLELPAK